MDKILNVSVRELVEYSQRSGDLDLTLFGGETPLRAIRAHQAIQRSRPKEYIPEYSISCEIWVYGYLLKVRGRIDGVYNLAEKAVIDEIKTTGSNLSAFKEKDNPLHWGQAKCYAYMYSLKHSLERIDIQLTYYNIEEKNSLEIRREYLVQDLTAYFKELAEKYTAWAMKISLWTGIRDKSITELDFPFKNCRKGQKEMIRAVSAVLKEGNDLLIQAPTGIGKTMGVMFPSLKSIKGDRPGKIFYLTARTTGRQAAEQCLGILRQKGLFIKHVSLTAKEKVCFNPEKACNGQECPYAEGFYDRINMAVEDAFRLDSLDREAVVLLAERHRLCPFEFSLELSLWVDCIICDYNYVFDPRVYLRRFFDNDDQDNILLVDEAHNLVDRSREMYSSALFKDPVLSLRRRLKNKLPEIYKRLGRINSFFLKAKKEIHDNTSAMTRADYPGEFCELLRRFMSDAEKWLSRNEKTKFRDDLLKFYFDVRRFVNTADGYDENYTTYYEKQGADLCIKLFCIDPSGKLQQVLKRCSSCIFLSATLTPMDYYRRIFGCMEDTPGLMLESPFTRDNLCVMVAGRLSVMYRHRQTTRLELARMIREVVISKRGNYLVFFPSYAYLKMVHEVFDIPREVSELIVQNPGMSEQDRELFLSCFNDSKKGCILGFAVMGGAFAESIDLAGDRLTGAVVVGVGFPPVSLERELIKGYFNRIDGSGLAFAYQIPGMMKVLQASGRVIRSENDRGSLLLVDTRYSENPYKNMMPGDWRPVHVTSSGHIGTALERFWKGF